MGAALVNPTTASPPSLLSRLYSPSIVFAGAASDPPASIMVNCSFYSSTSMFVIWREAERERHFVLQSKDLGAFRPAVEGLHSPPYRRFLRSLSKISLTAHLIQIANPYQQTLDPTR